MEGFPSLTSKGDKGVPGGRARSPYQNDPDPPPGRTRPAKVRGAGWAVGALVEAQLQGDTVQRPGQLHAAAVGGAAQFGGDGLPVVAAGLQVGQPPLFLAETAAELLQQFLVRRQLAGRLAGVGQVHLAQVGRPDPAHVAPLRLLLAHLVRQLVLGHPHQQSDELFRLLQVVLAGDGADEKAGQNRLTDVHRVEDAAQALVLHAQPDAHPRANDRLIAPHQLLRRLGVAGSDAADQVGGVVALGHGGPSGGRPGPGRGRQQRGQDIAEMGVS